MIAVLDTGLSNVGSVANMLRRLGHPSKLVTTPEEAETADRIILPGVGHFSAGVERLRETGLGDAIKRAAAKRKPILGICLGMQLLAEFSEEGAGEGLGLLPARVVKFDADKMSSALPIPHVGWSSPIATGYSPLLAGWDKDARYYFTHSYHMVTDDPTIGFLEADYGYRFLAAAQKGSVIGVQFHPEKSHMFGKRILQVFAEGL